MRRLVKRMAAALLAAACLFSLTACGSSQGEDGPSIRMDGTPVEDAMAQSLVMSAAQTLAASDEQLIVQKHLAEAQGDAASAQIYQEQLDIRSEMGGLKAVDLADASVVLLEDGSYTVMLPVTFDEGGMLYLLNLNMATQEVRAEFADTSVREVEDSSLAGLTKTASVNTAVGMGTVFIVLIFISLIIYCFKFIHQWEEGKKKDEEAPVPAPAPAPASVSAASAQPSVSAAAPAGDEDEELAAVIAAAIAAAEDDELVAVVTAAIAAYGGASASSNGLVVRSIRRVDRAGRR
ncbi:MAG TPA: OadG family protein [Candidatus Enterocloster excrementipullorum]|uniref:OadG family protein n=1 Tax=Candidatus Enterocloster excrementipullorum TaxID=2838559 RepID=A0A9D2SGP5_9FIRM|nr:OadG family protein [Candidatus Enterocloster excrementipullorum]